MSIALSDYTKNDASHYYYYPVLTDRDIFYWSNSTINEYIFRTIDPVREHTALLLVVEEIPH